ncbi:hypothetical protein ON010_g2824 [Phytophthora cinnamomi]|nr:hypothetical protein ON010_g2824 [Phytophthora cinnamomi]
MEARRLPTEDVLTLRSTSRGHLSDHYHADSSWAAATCHDYHPRTSFLAVVAAPEQTWAPAARTLARFVLLLPRLPAQAGVRVALPIAAFLLGIVLQRLQRQALEAQPLVKHGLVLAQRLVWPQHDRNRRQRVVGGSCSHWGRGALPAASRRGETPVDAALGRAERPGAAPARGHPRVLWPEDRHVLRVAGVLHADAGAAERLWSGGACARAAESGAELHGALRLGGDRHLDHCRHVAPETEGGGVRVGVRRRAVVLARDNEAAVSRRVDAGPRDRREVFRLPAPQAASSPALGRSVAGVHVLLGWRLHTGVGARRASHDLMICGLVSHGPSVINAVIIYVMDNLYQLLARKLTEFENYRTLDEHEAHLVAKRMPFHLVNSNASLWFLAFYVRRLDRVRERLWILLVAAQLIDNFKEVGLPLAVSVGGQVLTAESKRRRRQSLESLQSDVIEGSLRHRRKNSLPQLRAKQDREKVDVVKAATEQRLARVLMQKRQATYRDTFADYKELMVQFGYVTLYSPVFPLAAAFAWLNNTIESRSDLLKLVNRHGYQRPVAQHARGIGVWEKVLVSFAGVAVVVNCALVWTYELDELLPAWTDLQRFAFIVACEHVIFVIKAWLNWAAPEVPVTSSLGKKPVLPPAEQAIPVQNGSDSPLPRVIMK